MSNTIALYKLPEAAHYVYMEQRGEPSAFASIEALEGRRGFVMAPFCASAACPVVLLEPDVVERRPLDDIRSAPGEQLHVRLLPGDEAAERSLYDADFQRFHRCLDDGVYRKLVLARRHVARVEGLVDAQALFRLACKRYPHQMVALFSSPTTGTWLMATPEIMAEEIADGWRTMALAGTMTTPGPWSKKNREEQQLVADYISAVLRREAEEVHLSATYSRMAAQLYHLCTDISFRQSADGSVARLLSRLHPTPAVCGLPTDAARQMIIQGESAPRKYYSGFLGPLLMPQQGTHLFVSLRCMEVEQGSVAFYAGGGLLAESQADDEWQETENKMATMRCLFDAM